MLCQAIKSTGEYNNGYEVVSTPKDYQKKRG